MTILPRLLTSILVIHSCMAMAFADTTCTKKFKVQERHRKNKYKLKSRELVDLKCNDTFEGKYFKIVEATSNDAIKTNSADKILTMRAANVYFHLTRARNFWVDEMKSAYVAGQPKITIRLNILNSYSKQRHFKNLGLGKNYNNAWTIPEGAEPAFVPDRDVWGKEIWFSPMKKILTKDIYKSQGNNPIHESLKIVKDPMLNNAKNALVYQGLGLLTLPTLNGGDFLADALKRVGTIGALFGMLYLTKKIDLWFIEKYYYVDSAMIPEIIYHEFAHIALSDTMKTTHSVPVIEGMADYFAARISNRRMIYDKIKGHSSNNPKDTKKNSVYSPYLEAAWNAQSDFTLSTLWLGKTKFDKLNKTRKRRGQSVMVNYDKLILETHLNLTEESDIRQDLTKAMIDACKKECASKRAGINTLHQTFEEKGMN
jgi:hypothetical protein